MSWLLIKAPHQLPHLLTCPSSSTLHLHPHPQHPHHPPPSPHQQCSAVESLPLDTLTVLVSFLSLDDIGHLITLSRTLKHGWFHNEAMCIHLANTLKWRLFDSTTTLPLAFLHRSKTRERARRVWSFVHEQIDETKRWALNKGSTDEEIELVETMLKFTFSEALRASFRVHNGESEDVPVSQGLIDGCRLLSLKEISHEAQTYVQEWLPDLIPLTTESGLRCIATDRQGQIFLLEGRSLNPYWKNSDWLTFLTSLHMRADASWTTPL